MGGESAEELPEGADLEPSLGERWALVAPHRQRLLAIARRRCPSPADAEDCVHEAMVRTVAYPQLDPSRAGALLTTLVMRVSADAARRRDRELRGRPRLATVPGQTAPPDEAVVDSDEARWLAVQLERLSEREREVFERRVAGLTAVETAKVLKLSYKAVDSAFTRARGRLRLWAVTASLLIGTLVRRLRNRPSVVAAVLAVSAGCLLGAGPDGSNPRPGPTPPIKAGGAGGPGQALHAEVGASHAVAVAATLRPRSVDHATTRTFSASRPSPPSAPRGTKPDASVSTPPVETPGGQAGAGPITIAVFSQGGSTVQCLENPSLDPHNLGCPQP